MIHIIYKFKLKVGDLQVVKMPAGARILSCQVQDQMPCLWALVNPEVKETEDRLIEIFGTGNDIKYEMGADRVFIGTFQIDHEEVFVGHVFERTS